MCRIAEEESMATNLAIDNALIEEAVKAGKHRTKKAAVTAALEEYVKSRRRLNILEWMGRVDYFDDYDHKKLRQDADL
jgi:Arc/MetJ family transcription regulator